MSYSFKRVGSGTFGGSPVTALITIDVGDTVVVASTTSGSPITVTDDGGNTYVLKGTISNTRIYVALNVANPATIVTLTAPGSILNVLVVGTYIGIIGTGNTSTSGLNNQTVAAIDLVIQKNNIAVAAIDCAAGSSTITYTPISGILRGTQISGGTRMMGFCENSSPASGTVTNSVFVNKVVNPRNVAVELIVQSDMGLPGVGDEYILGRGDF